MPYLVEKGICSIGDEADEKTVYSGCNCGISHLTLLDDGTIYACRRFESPVGNIFESNFEEIFFSRQMEYYRNIDNIESCGKCRLLNYCRGCRAVAFGTSGNPFAKDPQCWYNG